MGQAKKNRSKQYAIRLLDQQIGNECYEIMKKRIQEKATNDQGKEAEDTGQDGENGFVRHGGDEE